MGVKGQRTVGDQVGEVVASMEHLFGSLVEIVIARGVQLVVDVVVDETVADAEELVEALLGRSVVAVGSQMPLSEEPRAIAGFRKSLGDRDLAAEHVQLLGAAHLTLHPRVHVRPLGIPTRHEHGSCGAANGVCVSLREAHAVSSNSVNRRRVQVRRAETIGIESALVVRQDKDNIGTSNALAEGTAAENRTTKNGRTDSLEEIASCLISYIHVVVFHG